MLLFIFMLFFTCITDKSPILKYTEKPSDNPSPLLGCYHIEAFDTLYEVICEGEIIIENLENNTIIGSWSLENVNPQSPFEFWFNSGSLRGHVDDDLLGILIWQNMTDNYLNFIGHYENEKIEGDWIYDLYPYRYFGYFKAQKIHLNLKQ